MEAVVAGKYEIFWGETPLILLTAINISTNGALRVYADYRRHKNFRKFLQEVPIRAISRPHLAKVHCHVVTSVRFGVFTEEIR
jgi:hypothetical protein